MLGDDGNPIIPYDREHQITFSEMEEAGTYPALYRYRYAKGGNGK